MLLWYVLITTHHMNIVSYAKQVMKQGMKGPHSFQKSWKESKEDLKFSNFYKSWTFIRFPVVK